MPLSLDWEWLGLTDMYDTLLILQVVWVFEPRLVQRPQMCLWLMEGMSVTDWLNSNQEFLPPCGSLSLKSGPGRGN